MTYGLRVYSGGGFLQIDSNTAGRILYQQVATGSVQTEDAGTGQVTQYVGFGSASPGLGDDSIVFIKPEVDASAYLQGTGQSFKVWSTVNTTFNYKVFKPANSSSFTPSGYGLVIYDENNTRVFSNGFFSSRLGGTITGAGTLTGSFWSTCGVLPQRMIPAVNTPGEIYMWMTTWSSGSTSQAAVLGFPGPQVSDVEDIFTNRWINSATPTNLFLKDF